jgi:outer membrane protein assembly factor BamB
MTKKAFLSALLIALMVLGGLPLVENLKIGKATQAASVDALTGTVTKLWNFTSDSEMVLSLVVSDGFVYAESGPNGGPYRILYCINASTGVQVWNQTGSLYRFAIANNYVYVGQGAPGAVFCLSASTGVQLWNYSYGKLAGTPVVKGGVVYVGGYDYTRSRGINIGFIYALDARTGRKIWSFSGPVGTSFYESPVLADANLYALSAVYTGENRHWNSAVYAFDSSMGEKLWNYSAPGQFNSLVASGQNVYVSSNFVNTTDITGGTVYEGYVLALNASNGTRIWDYPTSSSIHSPILANDTVYAVSSDGGIYALATSNGKPIWNYSIGLETSSPLLVDGYLYVGSSAGVHCFNASTGAVNWNFNSTYFAGSWGITIPVYINGVIYVGWNGNARAPATYYFYALDALNGDRIWDYTINGTARCSPVVTGSAVYIGATFPIEEYPYSGPGVLALNSTVTSLPHSTLFPFLTPLVIASVISVTVAIGLLVYLKKRKH